MSLLNKLIRFLQKQNINYYFGTSEKLRLFGDLAPLVPSPWQMFDGPQSLEEFKANGEEFMNIFKSICGLHSDEKILDIGCGIGRKTLPLTQFLNKDAVYYGLDINKVGISWCQQRITPRYQNFYFQQIDVYNKMYNPKGKYQANIYRFPFDDELFSFVILGSVFTHMLPSDLENYLSEISRMMQKGGRCLITYFLLNEESLQFIESSKSTLDFKYKFSNYRTISNETQENAIAFDEKWIGGLYQRLGLKIVRLDYGSWCGREKFLSYQDMILAIKE